MVLVAFVVVVLAIIGYIAYRTFSSVSTNQQNNSGSSKKMERVEDYLADGRDWMCTFQTSAGGANVTSKYYIARGKVRSEYSINGQTTYQIITADMLYGWTNQPGSKPVAVARSSYTDSTVTQILKSLVSAGTCTQTTVPDSMFTPPQS